MAMQSVGANIEIVTPDVNMASIKTGIISINCVYKINQGG